MSQSLKLFQQINHLYNEGGGDYELVYDKMLEDGHTIDLPAELKQSLWNDTATITNQQQRKSKYKSLLVYHYLQSVKLTLGKLYIYDAEDPNKKPIR